MKMNGNQTIPTQRQLVWEGLNDPKILRHCIPGCDSLTLKDRCAFGIVRHCYPVAQRWPIRLTILAAVIAPQTALNAGSLTTVSSGSLTSEAGDRSILAAATSEFGQPRRRAPVPPKTA